MSTEQRATEAFESWEREKGQHHAEGTSPESVSAFMGRGLVGCCILLLRQLRSGQPLTPYWRDGLIKVLLDLVSELQDQG